MQELPAEKLYSLRTHPYLKVLRPRDFRDEDFQLQGIGKVELTLEGPQLRLTGKDKQLLVLTGPESLLKLIAELLKPYEGQSWEQIKERLLLPQDANLLDQHSAKIRAKVDQIRRKILDLQQEIDKIAYKLYDLESE